MADEHLTVTALLDRGDWKQAAALAQVPGNEEDLFNSLPKGTKETRRTGAIQAIAMLVHDNVHAIRGRAALETHVFEPMRSSVRDWKRTMQSSERERLFGRISCCLCRYNFQFNAPGASHGWAAIPSAQFSLILSAGYDPATTGRLHLDAGPGPISNVIAAAGWREKMLRDSFTYHAFCPACTKDVLTFLSYSD